MSDTSHEEQPGEAPVATEVSIRRAPKVSVFIVVGALLGAIVTLILTSMHPADPNIGFLALYAYFCVYGIPAGIVLGALVSVTLDRISVRRAKQVPAERTQIVAPAEVPGSAPDAETDSDTGADAVTEYRAEILHDTTD